MFSVGSPENGTLIKRAIFLARLSLLLFGPGGGLVLLLFSDPGKYKYSKPMPIMWCYNQINWVDTRFAISLTTNQMQQITYLQTHKGKQLLHLDIIHYSEILFTFTA